MIPKKEVLKRGDISYGQFYRWKRKGLIPENWIIHKSTYTGQESFLPREKILERIKRIKELKDGHTLDEIAELLSPELGDIRYARTRLLDLEWINEDLILRYEQYDRAKKPLSFKDVVNLSLLNKLSEKNLPQETLDLVFSTLFKLEDRNSDDFKKGRIYLFKTPGKEDIYHCLISYSEPLFDNDTELSLEVKLGDLIREVKMNLKEETGGTNEN